MLKLYDHNAYTKKFTATVLSCEKADVGYKILLDQTAFFPTAGGQEFDPGTLNSNPVLDVFEENKNIYHITEHPIEPGTEVAGEIDWNVRFRKMQHHTAEHIVSGIVHQLFGYENTGFHLSDKDATVDYGGIISPEELLMIEKKANEAIWKNIPITAVYPPEEELSKIPYRSKLDLTEDVRIVTIDGIDICACCAPHVKFTGEIGLIKLFGLMHHRGGVRLSLICGSDALSDYQEKAENSLLISNLLSAKQSEIFDATNRIYNELAAKKQKIAVLSKQLALQKAELLCKTDGNICTFCDFDTDAMRILANEGKKICKIFAALSGNDESGYNFIIASEQVNLRECAKEITSVLSGRGGGCADMIQGFFKSTREEIENFFKNYEVK